jgi:TetR/AcrR family transcriptional repressor of bet genes
MKLEMPVKTSPVGRPKGENAKNANRRRRQLIDAAIKCVVEHGLSATTLASVAKESGLSQGTAIFYFKSKESLLNEAFRHRLEEYKQTWSDALSSAGPDPVDRIVAIIFALLDFRLLTPENLTLWNSFWTEAYRRASFHELSKQHDVNRQAILLSLCSQAKKHFSNTIWTPKTVAHALETMTEGAWSRLYYSPNYISVKEARVAAGTLLSAIFPSRSADIMRLATKPANNDYE